LAAAACPLDRLRCVPSGGEPGPTVGAVLRRDQNRGHRVVARGRRGDGVPVGHPAVPGRKRTRHRPVDGPVESNPRHDDDRHRGAHRCRRPRPRHGRRPRRPAGPPSVFGPGARRFRARGRSCRYRHLRAR